MKNHSTEPAIKPALTSFNLMEWIEQNKDQLRPPTAAKTVFAQDDFMTTVVGGPNKRTDYHINQTEELFFQLKGEMQLGLQVDGKVEVVTIGEGQIYLLPAHVPHAPMRGENTVGLIVERIRKDGMTDTHRWYCEKCNSILWEKSVFIENLERDMPLVFEEYYSDPSNQICDFCGHKNPGRPGN